MLGALKYAWLRFVALVYQPTCACCGADLPGVRDGICDACTAVLPWASEERVCRTGRKAGIDFAAAAIAPFYYADGIREAVHRLKFQGHLSIPRVMSFYIAAAVRRAVEAGEIPMPEVVTYVPVSRARYRKRGFDQSELLAEAMAKRLGIRKVRTLRKVRNTPAQSGLDEKTRRVNVLGVYRLRRLAPKRIGGRAVLLMDDVVTTGSTAGEAVKTLSYGLPGNVVCAFIAQTTREEGKNG